jgi:RNA polymerase sigma-70 factor, ECF subfamily
VCVLNHHGSDRNEVFVKLLMLHQQQLYGFIYTLVPSPADAEDLLQQTSLILWQKFNEFDLNRSFPAWACGIARLEVLHYLREKRRSHVVFCDELIAQLAETRQHREEADLTNPVALAGCIEKLPEGDRKLIKLCYGAKRNIKAAAAALDRPVTSVYTSLVRVRRLLMDCIQQTNGEEDHG